MRAPARGEGAGIAANDGSMRPETAAAKTRLREDEAARGRRIARRWICIQRCGEAGWRGGFDAVRFKSDGAGERGAAGEEAGRGCVRAGRMGRLRFGPKGLEDF